MAKEKFWQIGELQKLTKFYDHTYKHVLHNYVITCEDVNVYVFPERNETCIYLLDLV